MQILLNNWITFKDLELTNKFILIWNIIEDTV